MIRKWLKDFDRWIFEENYRLWVFVALIFVVAGIGLYFGAERMDRLRNAAENACYRRPCGTGLRRFYLTAYKTQAQCLCVGDEP